MGPSDPILKAALERDEGRRLKAYRDSSTANGGVGFWTIGVGHLLGSSPRMSNITDAECNALYVADCNEAMRAAQAVFPDTEYWHIVDLINTKVGARLRAIINMAFNRGQEHMEQSTTITPAIRTAIKLEGAHLDATLAWKAVGDAVLASPWGQQIKDRGKRLAKQFETGVDQ